MHKKLAEIIQKTKADLIKRKQAARPFANSLTSSKESTIAIIAEIKLASLNEGDLGNEGEVADRVKQYQKSGVAAISVVTEKHFFKGSMLLIERIKNVVSLPVLQKDFIVDSYQIYESKIAGADAVLLIAKILTETELISLVKLTKEFGMEPVVEINNSGDLKKTLKTNTDIIAVNARDLDTFEVDVEKACQLIKVIPSNFIKLGFSGIHSNAEVKKYKQAGAKAILVGTELMRASDIDLFIQELKNDS